MDASLRKSDSNFTIEIENENGPWHKIMDLYRSIVENPATKDDKREIFLQLAEDLKQQYSKTIKQTKWSLYMYTYFTESPGFNGTSVTINMTDANIPTTFLTTTPAVIEPTINTYPTTTTVSNSITAITQSNSITTTTQSNSITTITETDTGITTTDAASTSMTTAETVSVTTITTTETTSSTSMTTAETVSITTITTTETTTSPTTGESTSVTSTTTTETTSSTSMTTAETVSVTTITTTETTSSTSMTTAETVRVITITTTETTTSSTSTETTTSTTTTETTSSTSTITAETVSTTTITTNDSTSSTSTTNTVITTIATSPAVDIIPDNATTATQNLETSIARYNQLLVVPAARIRSIKSTIIAIGLLVFIFLFLLSSCVGIRTIIISVYYVLHWLYRFLSTFLVNTCRHPLDRKEKIVFLDPMIQYLHLHTLSEDNLFVYTSIHDCFRELATNRLTDYTLFLSLTDFEVNSYELSRLSNVSLGIFHKDNDQSYNQISKPKYRIRFIFPEERLLEHVQHAVILNYASEADKYRREGLEDEADECFLAASQHCLKLADYLKQQANVQNGSEPTESVLPENENTEDLVLRPFTSTVQH